mgnify:CR=1 FL=1
MSSAACVVVVCSSWLCVLSAVAVVVASLGVGVDVGIVGPLLMLDESLLAAARKLGEAATESGDGTFETRGFWFVVAVVVVVVVVGGGGASAAAVAVAALSS